MRFKPSTFSRGVRMRLKVKDMDIATGGILVATLHHDDANMLDLHTEDRVKLTSGRRTIVAALNISESNRAVPRGSIGLFEEAMEKLGVRGGRLIDVCLDKKPESVGHIRDKLQGKHLSAQALQHIINDIVNNRLTSIEKTYFVSGTYTRGLSNDEIVHLTNALVNSGKKLTFPGNVFDKHSVGGVPGNRTTMIIVPIVAAAGLLIPKTSSRAITSPAGTADTMEVLANVSLDIPHLKRTLKKTNGCIVWGGALNLAPADDKIIEVEHPLSLDAEGQMLASVMSKKASVGANNVLIDIPCGKFTKCKSKSHAIHLKHMFSLIARKLNMKAKIIITDGSQPIGNGMGPVLEARDVMWVLQNDDQCPADLRGKALRMAGMILEMGGAKKGYARAVELVESGDALRKMKQIIRSQGEHDKRYQLGEFHFDVLSPKKGKVSEINSTSINKMARLAGAPVDKGAGMFLDKKFGDKVRKGETLFTLYAENESKLKFAKELMKDIWVYHVK
jgi:putative thymidine phosphorylase